MQGVGVLELITLFFFFFLFLYICIRDIGGMNLMSIVLNYILLLFIHCVLHDQGQYRD